MFFLARDWVMRMGLDPDEVKLVRHSDLGLKAYESSLEDFEYFASFQKNSSTSPYHKAKNAIQFVVDAPLTDGTLTARFICAHEIGASWVYGEKGEPNILPKTIVQAAKPIDRVYELIRLREFESYEGRIVIDWGKSARVWSQWANTDSKQIVEFRDAKIEPSFPGYFEFVADLSSIGNLPLSWKERLSDVGGVYALTCKSCGKVYIGSAYGEGGFMGRWNAHRSTGGDSLGMRAHKAEDYKVTIVELTSHNATPHEVIERENLWKRKLDSVRSGLNLN